jgi:hypothetical protein
VVAALLAPVLLFVGQQMVSSLVSKYTPPAAEAVTEAIRGQGDGPPVDVHVENWTDTFAFTQPIQQLSPAPDADCSMEEYRAWAQRFTPAAIDTKVVVRVTAQTTKPTLYRGIEVRTHDRQPATRTTAIACQSGDDGGEVHVARVDFTEGGRVEISYGDAQSPTPHDVDPLVRGQPEYFVFSVGAAAAEEYAFDFDLLFSVDGQPVRHRVQDEGEPFRVTGLPADARWYVDAPTSGRWREYGTGAALHPEYGVWVPAQTQPVDPQEIPG